VATLMRTMGMRRSPQAPAVCAGPRPQDLPYLLRGMNITHAGQVWCADVTYLPWHVASAIWWQSWMGEQAGALLEALQHTRASFCIEALQEALERYDARRSSTPTRAPSHLRGFTGMLTSAASGSAWTDGAVAGQRLHRASWRSVKYEEVYLKAYESIPEARRELAAYFNSTICGAGTKG